MEWFRLKCQLLEVGDVCISLTPRSTPTPITSIATANNNNKNNHNSNNNTMTTIPKTTTQSTTASSIIPKSSVQRSFVQQPKNQYYPQPELLLSATNYTPQLPQNLSRKSQSITKTTMSAGFGGRPYVHAISEYNNLPGGPNTGQYYAHTQSYLNEHDGSTISATIANLYRNHSVDDAILSQKCKTQNARDDLQDTNQSRLSLSPDCAIDATTSSSRKRRWSAPDTICNIDGCQLDAKKCTLH